MASNTDDSSVDDNLSSIGDSTWDIIDDGSVATSDEDDRSLSRQYTESSDGNEQDHEDGDSLKEPEANDEFQGTNTSHEHLHIVDGQMANASLSEDSCTSCGSGSEIHHDRKQADVDTGVNDGTGYSDQASIIFEEPKTPNADSFTWVDVSHTLKVFEKDQMPQISQHIRPETAPAQVVASVRQTMSCNSLQLKEKEPYNVLYVGDPIAQQPIVHKIGEALASSLRSASSISRSGSSKYNIVPISAFADDTSPRVLLIDTPGLEMNVEDCTSASYSKEEVGADTISLTMKHGEKVTSAWQGTHFTVSDGWKLPDVAIVYVADVEAPSARPTRKYVKSFMARHGIPIIVISESPSWMKPSQDIPLDHKTPHLCLESRDPSSSGAGVLKYLPIDLSTFLDIDVHQMGRNLACLASFQSAAQSLQKSYVLSLQSNDEHDKPLSFVNNPLAYVRTHVAPEVRSVFAIGSVLLLAVLLTVSNVGSLGLKSTTRVGEVHPSHGTTTSISATTPSFTPASFMSTYPGLPRGRTQRAKEIKKEIGVKTMEKVPVEVVAAKRSVMDRSISIVHSHSDLTSFLLDTNVLAPNRSDKFKIQVVGDCHIVLRPPHWFMQTRRPPPLLFRVFRQEQTIEHRFSTLFDGVHALRLPREEAHGLLNISVWTKSKPRMNETFQVDFGSAWLKVAGWKKAALAVKDQIRAEMDSAQTGLEIFYGHTSTGLQSIMREAAGKANSIAKEAEFVGLTALNQTVKTTEIMVAQTKELSHKMSQGMHQRRSKFSSLIQSGGEHLRHDVTVYIKQASSLISRQAQVMSQAATGVNVKALKDEITDIQMRYLRETQKKALRIWWTFKGLPARKPPSGTGRGRSKPPRKTTRKGSNR